MYTQKLELAIQAAALLHEEHQRKGAAAIPYITHLMAVTFILRDYTTDENTLVAALLHDTLEDSVYTESEMKADFGEAVTELVVTLTEPANEDRRLSWLEVKRQYATQLKKGPLAAVHIAAADKIHNFRSMIDEYHQDHNRFLQDFGATPSDRIEAYQTIANVINSRLKDGIVHEFNHTFELYKQFVIDVQENLQG